MWKYFLFLTVVNFTFVALNIVYGNNFIAAVNFLAGWLGVWLAYLAWKDKV